MSSLALSTICYTVLKEPGYKIMLSPDGDKWKAMVHDNHFPGLSRSFAASVIFEKGYHLENFITKDPVYQSDHIHIFSTKNKKSVVYLGSFGLKGGGCHGQPTWSCWCREGTWICPNNCCTSCCSHAAAHKGCILKLQILQEKQKRDKLRRQKEEREALERETNALKESIKEDEARSKACSQNRRAQRTISLLALEKELNSKKQAILQQSSSNKTSDLYNSFMSNLELEVTLKESITKETTTVTHTSEIEENCDYQLEISSNQHAEETSLFTDDYAAPDIDPALPFSGSSCPPLSKSLYKQLFSHSADSESCQFSSDCQDDTDCSSEDSDLDDALSISSMPDLENSTFLESTCHSIPLRKSASLDNILDAFSVKEALLIASSPLTRLLSYYSLRLSPKAYLSFLRETSTLIQKAPLSDQKDLIDHVLNGGLLYPDIIKEFPSSEWLVRSLVQDLTQDPAGPINSSTLQQFSYCWNNLCEHYALDEQILLLRALLKEKNCSDFTLSQLTYTLEIISATGRTGFDIVCREQPDKLIHLKYYWISDQVNSLSQFASSPEACHELTDVLSRTHLSPSFIINLISFAQKEDDLPSLLGFLELVIKRKVPELLACSIIYEEAFPPSASESKAYQWLTSLCYELSLMHLSKVNADVSDSIAHILYDQIKQDPMIAPALEAFVYSQSHSIVNCRSIFEELLALIFNYNLKEDIATSVFNELLALKPSEWISKADQLIVDKLFQAGQTYKIEELIKQTVKSAPLVVYNDPSSDHYFTSASHLKKNNLETIFTHQIIENLKPMIKNQLDSIINDYKNKLATLQTEIRKVRQDIHQLELRHSKINNDFQNKKRVYKIDMTRLKSEEERLEIEIKGLEKEMEESLKKSEEVVKRSEEALGEKVKESAAPTKSGESKTKLAELRDRLNHVIIQKSQVKKAHKEYKEAWENEISDILKQESILRVDLEKLEKDVEPITLKVNKLLKEDATNFSDRILYEEVLHSISRLTPILRTSDGKAIDPCSPSDLGMWSKEIKSKGSTLFSSHHISEIITGINRAFDLSYNEHLKESQLKELLRILFPFGKQSENQLPKNPLVVISLTALCALHSGQVLLSTDSKEWPITEPDILSALHFFEILDLTVTRIDRADPSASSKSNVVYGKSTDYLPILQVIAYHLLQQKQQHIDSCLRAPSSLLSVDSCSSRGFQYDPISKWNNEAVNQWASYLQHHAPSRGTLLFESMAVIQRAAELIQGAPLTLDQRYGFLTLIYPSLDKGQFLEKARRDHLVAAMFTAFRSLQARQSHCTVSERSVGIEKHESFFNLLNLTLTTKKSAASSEHSSITITPSLPSKIIKGSQQLSEGQSSIYVNPGAPALSKLHPIQLTHSSGDSVTSLDSAGVDTDVPIKARKGKEVDFTPKDATDQTVYLSQESELKKSLVSNCESITEDHGTHINSIQESAVLPDTSDAGPPSFTVAYEQLKKQYDAFEEAYQSPSAMLQISSLPFKETPIAQWNEKEIKEWSTFVQSNFQPGSEIELISGVYHAVKLHYPFSPTLPQLIALLVLLHPTYDKGRLAQMNTGEGKSLVFAMLAAIHSLQGKKVDVVTTSTELSIPEVKEKKAFFELLNLSVSENSSSGDKRAIYEKQIVYGTACNFQADILREEHLGVGGRGDRGYDIVLVDEVDSLMYDYRSHSVRLASSHPGMDHLKLPLGIIWHYSQWVTDHMFKYEGTVYFTASDSLSPDTDVTTDESIIPVDDERNFITEMTENYLRKLLRHLDETEAQKYDVHFKKRQDISRVEAKIKSIKDKGGVAQEEIKLRDKLNKELLDLPWNQYPPIIDIPNHLRGFAQTQLLSWIKNCLSARFDYKLREHYIVSKENKIVPVQYKETGVLQPNLVWSDGLCQFLQIKEGLLVDPESITTNSFSTVGYFKRYGNSIFGLTGTLGGLATRSFLEKLYGLDFVVIPPHKRLTIHNNSHSSYLCKELRPILVEEKDWCPRILYHLMYHAKQGRSVLAICKSIEMVEYLERQLRAHYDPAKVFSYNGVTTLKEYKVNSGDIIVATNIAGRGTDLKTSPEVEDKGGMYVCVTFLPDTNRVELQNVGRTARAGKKGMAQLIICAPDGSSLKNLKEAREAQEKKNSERALETARKALDQDALLDHFCTFVNKYLPSAADCLSMDQAATILPAWKKVLETEFTDSIVEEQFQLSIEQARQKWHNLFSGDEVPNRMQLDAELTSKKDDFRSVYRGKLLEDFQSAHPNLSISLLSCMRNGESFIPNRPLLAEKNNWGTFERKAVEERWGIWLKAQPVSEEEQPSNDTLSMFKKFDDEFAVQIAEDADADQLIKNPYFYTLKGNKLYSIHRTADAVSCYERAIKLDPIFSLHSRYNKARALLAQEPNKGYKNEVFEELEEGKILIATVYRPNLLAFHGLVGSTKGNTETVKAIQYDMDVVFQQEKYIEQALEVLKTCEENDNVELTNESLHSTFKDPAAAVEHDHAIREAGLKGLSDVFTIKRKPPYPLFGIICMSLLAVGQIALGYFLMCYGGVNVGLQLIQSGIDDMVTAIKAAFKGTLDWGAWALQKCMQLVTAVASYGLKVAKEAVRGVQNTAESVKKTLLSGKQAFVDMCKKRKLADIQIQGLEGAIVKNAPSKVAGKALSSQLKKRAVYELMSTTAECAADELFMKQQEEKIRQAVKVELTEAFKSNKLISDALKFDRDQANPAWQQCFLGEAHNILNDMFKVDKGKEFLKNVGKEAFCDAFHSERINAGPRELLVGVNVVKGLWKSLSNNCDTIAPQTKPFIKAFNKRIATYKDRIEQSNQSRQTPINLNDQTIRMAVPSLIDSEGEIPIAEVNEFADFRPPDRSGESPREIFHNLPPSTPENLASGIADFICNEATKNLRSEIMSGVNYGSSWACNKLFEKATQENQMFLKALELRSVKRYFDIKKERQQKILDEKNAASSTDQPNGEKSEKNCSSSTKQPEGRKPEEKCSSSTEQPNGRKPEEKCSSSTKQPEGRKPEEKSPYSTEQPNGQKPTEKCSSSTEQPNGRKPEEKCSSSIEQPNGRTPLDPDSEKAIEDSKNGKPLTIGHIRMMSHLASGPIQIFDETGEPIGEAIGKHKAGKPILFRLTRSADGIDHIEPVNLTEEQRDLYQCLDHTKNNCALNALFTVLSKDKQEQLKSPNGIIQATEDYMRQHPELCRDLFKYQEELRQFSPAEVPRVGFVPAVFLFFKFASAGMFAWTSYKVSKDIVNDPKLRRHLDEGNYTDALLQGSSHLPIIGDCINGANALKNEDYFESGMHFFSPVISYIGGKVLSSAVSKCFKPGYFTRFKSSSYFMGKWKGDIRRKKFGKNWGNFSLNEALKQIAPDAKHHTTSGKIIFLNTKTGIQILHDKAGDYFRVENSTLKRSRRYLIPKNGVFTEHIEKKGDWQMPVELYEAATHFSNTDYEFNRLQRLILYGNMHHLWRSCSDSNKKKENDTSNKDEKSKEKKQERK